MNKIGIFCLILAGLTFTNCSNDFELIEPKGEIPVVYALLDADETYINVRLERAFASPTVSAEVLAKNPDSLYYKNAVVKLIKNNTSIVLEKIDLAALGQPKQDGSFVKSPNYIYRTLSNPNFDLNPGDVVKIEIDINEGAKITGETKIIQKVNPGRPNTGSNISFSETSQDQLRWNRNDNIGGFIHNVEFRIDITEVKSGKETKKQLIWEIAKNVTGESVTLEANAFFTFLKNNLLEDNATKRYIDGLDFYVTSGDQNLQNYLLVGQANNGITSSGEIPVYSNLSRGYGLFGSKAVMKVLGLSLNPTTFDKLKDNPLTKGLNFQ